MRRAPQSTTSVPLFLLTHMNFLLKILQETQRVENRMAVIDQKKVPQLRKDRLASWR
jgi:hypothetical protein